MRRNSEPVLGNSEQIRVPKRSNTLVHRLSKPLGVRNIRWELLTMPRLSEEKDKHKQSDVSNPAYEEETVETDRPPPLPPRKRVSDVDPKLKRHSAPPSPSWNAQQVYPVNGSSSRAPSKRKRDSFQKKKYEYKQRTRAHSSSSSCCSIEDYNDNKHNFDEETSSRSGSRTPDPDHYNRDILLKSAELFAQPMQKMTQSKPSLKYSPSSLSWPEMESANHIDSIDKLRSLERIFKNRRSPTSPLDNRKMEFTIGHKPIQSNSVDSSPAQIHRDKTKILRQRPHSFGLYGQQSHDGNMLLDLRNALKQQKKTDYYKTKRKPLMVHEDPGSVSDLECIMENIKDRNSFDVSRENSLVSEEEVSSICKDLCRLTVHNQTENGYVKVLPSPRVSPDIFSAVPGVIVTSDSEDTSDSQKGKSNSPHRTHQFLSVPRKIKRSRSSGSVTSGSDESDSEVSPPLSRRGRRAAIVDTKNFGDVSPSNLSPELSPSNSCDEGETASNLTSRLRRRRSSVELAMNIYPGDLLVQEHHKRLLKRNTVADFNTLRNGSSQSISDDGKKGRQSFSLLKLMRSRSKEAIAKLEDLLSVLKPSEFKDNHLLAYKNLHWSDLIACSDKQPDHNEQVIGIERKRREAVWELFKSECVFLIDHLMVIKHCFMEPLKKVQVEGHLMYAEPQDIFGNLDEICYVSYTFCKDFIAVLLKDMSSSGFGSTRALLKAFDRFITHSKDGGVYHTYCLNYTNALTYIDKLRCRDDFAEFEKWCEQDPRCKRLQLADLLVAPMQHVTKFPLLLANIRKYTENEEEIAMLADTIDKMGYSLQQMEDKMRLAKNYERLQDIQRQLVWPPVTDFDHRIFIPEYLKTTLLRQPCEKLLCCPTRQLIHEGPLTLVETTKSTDVYLFLFDDILLITRSKKGTRKKQSINEPNLIKLQSSSQSDKTQYTVHRQPIALDRLSVHDVSQSEAAANGIKCAFVIVQISRFQQIIGVYTMSCPSDASKNAWLEKLAQARGQFSTEDFSSSSGSTFKDNDMSSVNSIERSISHPSTSPGRHQRHIVLHNHHTKSNSVDSVYI
ncbi:uncharacterized protein LOC134717621 isoform X3 [Mytilus trossulus]|uniref:uncharacterized protein LOC134717621 isoform X3 n=1 Tax=Mytilus trossulus TaxID=6551 RepID=UPI003007EBA9